MTRFFTLFLLLSLLFFWVLSLDSVQPAVDGFSLFLARASFLLVHGFDSHISLSAAVLRHGSDGFALEVTQACNALSLSALWVAAVLVAPLTGRGKGLGITLGLLLLQSFNLLRIISLLYLGAWLERPQFDLIHEQFLPLLLHLLAIIAFGLLLGRCWQAPEITEKSHAGT